MRYRALVGIKAATGAALAQKDRPEREAYHIQLMKDMLKQWNSREPVPAYYDDMFDADKAYEQALMNPGLVPDDVNIDDPKEVLNAIGKLTGHVFYAEVPAHDKRDRDKKAAEYEKAKSAGALDADDELMYKQALVEPQKGEKTGVYPYCVVNPDGMFSSYTYPIEHTFNECVSTMNASRLINKNYGTPHDILHCGDLDYEGTYLPQVVFRYDGKMFESDDPDEIKAFIDEKLGNKDYVALIECEI